MKVLEEFKFNSVYELRDFRKNSDLFDEESLVEWYSLFDDYSIDIKKNEFKDEDKDDGFSDLFEVEQVWRWFEDYEDKLEALLTFLNSITV